MRSQNINRDHPGDAPDNDSIIDNVIEESSPTTSEDTITHDDGGDDSHVDEVAINPDAREGHYHVYLDSASGDDPHLTSWQHNDSFELSEDISTGMHSLRFELRDNSHAPVGIETIYFFEVVE